jgi:hypothetical protein
MKTKKKMRRRRKTLMLYLPSGEEMRANRLVRMSLVRAKTVKLTVKGVRRIVQVVFVGVFVRGVWKEVVLQWRRTRCHRGDQWGGFRLVLVLVTGRMTDDSIVKFPRTCHVTARQVPPSVRWLLEKEPGCPG